MKTKLHHSTLSRRAKTSLLLLSLIGLVGGAQAADPGKSPSEILEQGIYSEETKGDLDAAMQFYQQVVAEAKTGQALAAQAQYRLGVCYYKKKNYPEATAAFEKVVKDYPDQKELVASANEYLAGAVALLPAPWADGEELRFELKFPSGFKAGTATYSVRSGELNGRKIWRLGSRLSVGVQQMSRTEVEADSFKPIRSRWKHSMIGDASTVYSAGRAEVKLKGKDEVNTVELKGACYDNEEVLQLMRRLPLAANYETTLHILTSLGGGNVVSLKVNVLATEQVQTPAGDFDCYKVRLSLVNQTFWYSADAHRYLVKFEGGGVIAELASVRQTEAGEAFKPDDADFDVALTGTDRTPTIEPQNSQSEQNQAKLLILSTAMLRKVPAATNWCDALNASGARVPPVPTNTVFALNAQVAGRTLASLPTDTVVFFETSKSGWNQSGGAELIATKSIGAAVAFADGRALVVDAAEVGNLRWSP